MSLRAPHLFDALSIADMAYAKAPIPIIWAVSSNGKLLGLTYVPEQQIGAIHQHDTGNGDVFLSVCAVAEGDRDVLYAAVRRTIGGSQKTYIERFAPREFTDVAECVFVDSSLSYSGSPVSSVSGLDHLEGCTVSILADGSVRPQQVVTSGTVSLDEPASVVHVGLPIEADIKTLPMALEIQGFGQGRVKNVNRVWLRTYRSSGVFAGPAFNNLTEHKQRRNEPMGSPPTPVTDELEIAIANDWQSGGHVCVRQRDPLPLTIVSMSVEVSVGG
jgi:hypothetical protein